MSSDDSFLDAGPDEAIDYPEELQSLADEGETIIAVVTPLVAPLMEELGTALAVRLAALDKPADAVYSDLSLATDASSVAMARAEGYAPLREICAHVPDCVAGLEAAQLDAIYLRLCWMASGEACNDLFLEDAPEGDAGVADATAATLPMEAIEDFGDVLADDPHGWLDEEIAGFDTATLPEIEDTDDTLFDGLAAEDLAPGPEAAYELPEPAVASTDQSRQAANVAPGFDDDALDADGLDAELAASAGVDGDVDALIEDLVEARPASDVIWGAEVDALAVDSEAHEEAALHAVAAAAAPDADRSTQDMSWCIPEGINFSQSSPTGGEIFAEFLDAFLEEGASELEKLEDAVAAWEGDINSEDAYRSVTRTLHTIKGIAKGVGLHFYGTLIHNFETLLEGMPRPDAGADQDYFRIVNAWLDAAVRGLDQIRESRVDIATEFPQRAAAGPAVAAAPVAEDIEPGSIEAAPEVAEVHPVADAAAAGRDRDKQRKAEDKRLADEGARALAAQQSVRITSEKLDLLLNLTNQAHQLGVRTAQNTARNKRTSAELLARLSSVRSHISDIADRALFNVTARGGVGQDSGLDALEMDRYSELQEAANILREGVEDLAELIEIASRNNAQAEALLKQQSSVISSIGSTIRAARVVPVSRLMPGLRRLVRTVSNDLGKDVAFRVGNEVGTLDRDDYSRCQTILEHMVRNALDHGIESAEERRAAGKPTVGQISVDARTSGSDSLIILSDDGRGIDPAALRESAIRKGLDVDADALSDEEALRLIFHRGFSTARSVSQISGRGVGMDIVLSELQQMGGDVEIASEVGKGTTFRIRIPSNVTVNGALLVTAGEASYAIPLGGLVAVDEVPVDEFFAAVEGGSNLTLAGMECEPSYLGTLCKSGMLPERSSWRRSVPVIVAGTEERRMAIAIDDVEEALELVIRSLGAQFAAVPGVAGAATTADGEAVVALDLNMLVASLGAGEGSAIAIDETDEASFLALVVDDSRTQRMVATSQLETVGIETATAENGAIAIDWLNTTENLPDVILLDVEMPVKDGIQTLREIRKSARYSHIPVIMVTSRTGIKHRTLAEEAGCNGYMGKPFNFRMLIGQINELTGHRLQLG
jgi:chemosensory pili system protein ChpA (sensor histidine kinase/response regulator)